MRTTVLVRFGLLGLSSLLAALAPAAYSAAATLEISVVDEEGRPIEEVAVYATPTDGAVAAPAALAGSEPQAVMDQKDLQFVPHMLIVQTGTEVTFPNGDDVSHHVYSFSEA